MSVPTEKITQQRLASWAKELAQAHATPVVLVGVGHDQTSGQLHMCVPEGISQQLLIGCLLFALKEIVDDQMPATPEVVNILEAAATKLKR